MCIFADIENMYLQAFGQLDIINIKHYINMKDVFATIFFSSIGLLAVWVIYMGIGVYKGDDLSKRFKKASPIGLILIFIMLLSAILCENF